MATAALVRFQSDGTGAKIADGWINGEPDPDHFVPQKSGETKDEDGNRYKYKIYDWYAGSPPKKVGYLETWSPLPSASDKAGAAAAAANPIVTRLEWHAPNGKTAVTLEGLSIPESSLLSGIGQADSEARYAFLVSLLDGDVKIVGGKGDETSLEVGEGGTATIKAKGGDDHVFVWHQKNIVFDGGGGSDTIEFAHDIGGGASAPGAGAVVDLTKGTGTNPFGGTLKLKGVENVIGTFDKSNDLRGDKHDNRLNGGTAADTLRGEKGDDTIVVKYHTTLDPRATFADGGKGKDTLYAELSDSSAAPYVQTGPFTYLYINILDLENPGENTGTYHGGTFTNFEIYQASSQGEQRFDFRGSERKETVIGGGSTDLIDGRGGNDVLDGAWGNDELTSGPGRDLFVFRLSASTANADIVTDFGASDRIQVDGDIFGVSGKGKKGVGVLKAKFFAEGSAKDGNDYLVYDKPSGDLFADWNGKDAGGAILIAHFNGNPDIGAKDILVA
jgi:Ca2+-binding RTX toxin-like protein